MADNETTRLVPRHCSRCGTEIPPNLPPEVCPKCLMELGLGTPPPAGPGGTVIASPAPASTGPLLQPGQQFGPYHIVRLLGAGGMGAVYEAEDLENSRRIALKVLGHALDTPEARRRFLREGRLAASINHPNSVYVFGTDEISGIPVIAMELVPGGTLRERVASHGPLPVGQAVDAILQIVAGLEAAQEIGILHRDVKPSNCFIDLDGSVKIGDFGLSLSTAIRTDVTLTATGAYLGTPAFSSPEQLRGEEVTVRSDIYAVGVTMYYLLTNRMPFAAPNMVQLLATVLERQPESPDHWKPGIPKGLCQVVLKCLQKDAGERFRKYQELRAALAPFSSSAPAPAPLSMRFLAGLVDSALIGIFGFIVTAFAFGGPEGYFASLTSTSPYLLLWIALMILFMLSYYMVLEGLWGAGVGKALCRLRVIGPDKNPPGMLKALARTTIFSLLPALPYWIYLIFHPATKITRWTLGPVGQSSHVEQLFLSLIFYAVIALLFSTARRRNGFAAVHDLVTNTRVIRMVALTERPHLPLSEPQQAIVETGPRVGPYHVLETLQTSPEQWILGYDTRLLRKVLIHVVPADTPPVPSHLRNLGRAGRVRWLGGRRSADENWDAYEGLNGQPLPALLKQPRPWAEVRFWLMDLATELSLAEKDGTVPVVLDLDRVWITGDGRAKLLDFPAPGSNPSQAQPPAATPGRLIQAQLLPFLQQVAQAALEGQARPSASAPPVPTVPLPLHARKFLDGLFKLSTPDMLAAELRPLLQRIPQVSRRRRAAIVGGCLAFPMIAGIGLLVSFGIMQKIQRTQPELIELNQILGVRQTARLFWAGNKTVPDDRMFGIYIAKHYGEFITNSPAWSSLFAASMISGENRRFAEECVTKYASPSEQELRQAEEKVSPYLKQAPKFSITKQPWIPLAAWGGVLIIYVALPALVCALLFRGGLVLLLSGVAVVRKDGSRAGRLRVFWRNLIAWAPVFVALILMTFLAGVLGVITAAAFALALVLGLAILSLLRPERSLQDQFAGTWLVPR